MKRSPVAIILVLAALLAGCGGSSKGSGGTAGSGGKTAHAATAVATLTRTARLLERALQTGNCTAFTRIAYDPRLAAARCKAQTAGAKAAKLSRVRLYAEAGAADYALGGSYDTAFFVHGLRHVWRMTFMLHTKRAFLATRPKDPAAGAANLKAALQGIANGSCTNAASDIVTSRHASAKATAANCYGRTGGLLEKVLKKGFTAPKALGGNTLFSFYLSDVGKPAAPFVFAMLEQGGRLRLLGEYRVTP